MLLSQHNTMEEKLLRFMLNPNTGPGIELMFDAKIELMFDAKEVLHQRYK